MKRVILLADDSPTIQRLVTQLFQDADHEVVSVSNGDAAIRKFEEIQPALVLADIYMPGRNGYEVCAWVKKHPKGRQTPVVLLAGAFDAFDEETAYQVGAATHVTKPFEPHALLELVESLLSSKREEEARAALPPPPPPETPPASVDVPENVPDAPIAREKEYPEEVAEPAAMAPQAPESEPIPEPAAPPAWSPAKPPVSSDGSAAEVSGDLLGLQELFTPPAAEPQSGVTVSDEEIERIADRVIQKISTQIIESVAWDVVPDITTRVLREELKRHS